MAELVREKGSKNLRANIGYSGGEEVLNDFDSRYPWNEIKIITDENENVWVRIPKFYTHYVVDENHNIKERYISEYKVDDDWHLNPIFINEEGHELPYVEISAYLATLDGGKLYSKTGLTPTTTTPITTMRTAVNAYNSTESEYNYGLFNIWTSILEQDLFTIEFANSNIASILQGYNYNSWKNGIKPNGDSDDISYVTGTKSANAQDNGTAAMKYRGIENMTGNGRLVVDGIKINNGDISVSYDGSSYHNVELQAITSSGRVQKLRFDSNSKLVFPSVLVESDSAYVDRYVGNNDANQVIVRGQTTEDGCGLFATVFISEDNTNKYNTYRMIRRPKN